jgi:CRISPR-associated endoribonuclease Cas6
MRIKLNLQALDEPTVVPLNYNYLLSAAIYATLRSASAEYSSWLHSVGYMGPDGKPLKLFTFSKLQSPKGLVENGNIILRKDSTSFIQISSPMFDEFVQNLVVGLFISKTLTVANRRMCARFLVTRVEMLKRPVFHPSMKFVCLSPFVVSGMEEKDGVLRTHYLRPDDPNLSESIRKNLVRKHGLIYRTTPEDDRMTVTLDEQYIARRGGIARVSKLITIKEGSDEETRVYAIQTPLTLEGSSELMETAYESGIGTKNSVGFGMLGVYRGDAQR